MYLTPYTILNCLHYLQSIAGKADVCRGCPGRELCLSQGSGGTFTRLFQLLLLMLALVLTTCTLLVILSLATVGFDPIPIHMFKKIVAVYHLGHYDSDFWPHPSHQS